MHGHEESEMNVVNQNKRGPDQSNDCVGHYTVFPVVSIYNGKSERQSD